MDVRDWRGLIRLRYAQDRARRAPGRRAPTAHSAHQSPVSAGKNVPESEIRGHVDRVVVHKVGGGEG
jgi:hypothetical protein